MNLIHMVCPECSGNLLVQMGSFPIGSTRDGDSYRVRCPLCASEFPIGYISEFKKVEPTSETSDSIEVQHTMSDGYSFVGMSKSEPSSSDQSKPAPSPNDQRSNALNPNNSASSAAANNRSSQMNPNNSAYRSSRR